MISFFTLTIAASHAIARSDVTTSPEVEDPIASYLEEDWFKKGWGGLGGGFTTIGGGMGGGDTAGCSAAQGYTSYFTSYFTETVPAATVSYITVPGEATTVYYTPTPVVSTIQDSGASTITYSSASTGPLSAYTTSYYVTTL